MGKTLSIQNVNKSFTVDGQKVDVLKDINLEIREGEVYRHRWSQWLWKKYSVKNHCRT